MPLNPHPIPKPKPISPHRPFTPPTRHDAAQFYHSTRRTLRLLAQEGAALLRCLRAAAAHLSWRRVLPLAVYLGLQWLAARVEFGLVFFIVAMLALIFTVGLGDDASRRGRNGERLSPWRWVFLGGWGVEWACDD